MAKENPGWDYDRIVGAMANLGHRLSDQTVGNILRRHGLSPAPMRKQVKAMGTTSFFDHKPGDEWLFFKRKAIPAASYLSTTEAPHGSA